ncbi:MAG: hypothetical protein ACK43N_22345, partial [Pirellulaceae bacterium]
PFGDCAGNYHNRHHNRCHPPFAPGLLAFTTIGATHLLAILLAFFPAAICINELLAPPLVPPTFRIHLSANLLPLVRAAIGHKQTLRIASPSLAAG